MAEGGAEDYVNVIIFAVIYGALMILIVGHAFVRWNSRRKSLTHWKPRTPGDSSFKNKKIRAVICEDFENIRRLSSNPQLLQDGVPISSDAASRPGYWYRMRAFDCAAEFVSTHSHLLGSGRSQQSASTFTPVLPHFLSQLQQQSGLLSDDLLISQTVTAYKNARYNTGVFSANELEQFCQLLGALERMLSDGSSSPEALASAQRTPPVRINEEITAHSKATARYSREPLLEGEEGEGRQEMTPSIVKDGSSIAKSSEEKDTLRSLSYSSKVRKGPAQPVTATAIGRSNRPISLEIPLIDSQASTPLSTSSPFFGQKATAQQ